MLTSAAGTDTVLQHQKPSAAVVPMPGYYKLFRSLDVFSFPLKFIESHSKTVNFFSQIKSLNNDLLVVQKAAPTYTE